MRPEKTVKPQGREGRLKGRIRMLVCADNAVSRGIKVNMFSFKFALKTVSKVIVLRERERKRIAPHQHLSDFIAMLFLLAGNA